MPNHFHFLVKVKAMDEMLDTDEFKRYSISRRNGISLKDSELYSDFISEQFRRLFLSYSKSINKQSDRKGSLFCKGFKRKQITSLQYLQQAVVYIHRNPVHHDFDVDFHDYRWSSYDRVLEDKITKLKKREVLEWFGDKENYRYAHNTDIEDDIE
jgi:REP element-mobilizing transposase RayT